MDGYQRSASFKATGKAGGSLRVPGMGSRLGVEVPYRS